MTAVMMTTKVKSRGKKKSGREGLDLGRDLRAAMWIKISGSDYRMSRVNVVNWSGL